MFVPLAPVMAALKTKYVDEEAARNEADIYTGGAGFYYKKKLPADFIGGAGFYYEIPADLIKPDL
jgi:hypothetical protein